MANLDATILLGTPSTSRFPGSKHHASGLLFLGHRFVALVILAMHSAWREKCIRCAHTTCTVVKSKSCSNVNRGNGSVWIKHKALRKGLVLMMRCPILTHGVKRPVCWKLSRSHLSSEVSNFPYWKFKLHLVNKALAFWKSSWGSHRKIANHSAFRNFLLNSLSTAGYFNYDIRRPLLFKT